MQSYSNWVYLHSYCSERVYLHIYKEIDAVRFWEKMCKFHSFFFFYYIDVNAQVTYFD